MRLVRSSAAFAARPLLLVALVAAPGAAQSHGPPVLRLPAGTRALAMGDAGVALADVDAIFYNPAQLAVARGFAGGAQRYGAGATLASLALVVPFAPGGLGLGVQVLDYSASCGRCAAPLRAAEGALATDGARPTSASVLSLSFGRDVSGVRVGVTGKYVEQRLPEARAGAAAVDVGVARRVGPVWIGASAQNVGARLRFAGPPGGQELARRATVGAAFEGRWVGPFDLSASAAVSVYDGGEVVPGGGVELGYSPLEGYAVAGRIGVRRVVGDGLSPVSLGAAFMRDRVMLEYAFQALDAPGDLHRVGLRLRP